MESLEAKVEKLKNAWHEFTMGIMDSDLVKFGVDILTKFLEIVNKATDGIAGFGGGLSKIISVLAIFKLGSKLFEKFRKPLVSFFAEIVTESFNTGKKATEQFVEGTKAGAKPDSSSNKTYSSRMLNGVTPKKLKKGYSEDSSGRVRGPNGRFVKREEAFEE
jgi:hypothetical protein